MKSTQSLVISLNESERKTLYDALDIFEEVIAHLELNRDLGLAPYRYELQINCDAFWKIMHYCIGIEADEAEHRNSVGEYGNKNTKN